MFDRRPAIIVRPSNVEDVVAAVRFGREVDLEIAVRGGGHSAVGHSTTDGGLVIDLVRLDAVSVDPERRLARTGGGALLGKLDIAAQEHGLVCPVGVVGHTGVAGLTLGGGVGRLQRRFGLTIDSLRSVELVTAEGDVVRASADEEPELFWGLRGAGANFGIATSLELEVHPFSGTLHRGVHVHPADRHPRALADLPRFRGCRAGHDRGHLHRRPGRAGRELPGRGRRSADRRHLVQPQRGRGGCPARHRAAAEGSGAGIGHGHQRGVPGRPALERPRPRVGLADGHPRWLCRGLSSGGPGRIRRARGGHPGRRQHLGDGDGRRDRARP